MSRPLRPSEDTTLRPSWLVRHAEQLANRVSATELPRSAHPRRAVSAAYYAVFHRITIEVAFSSAPQAGRQVWFQVCREFGHEGVSKVCGWITGNPAPTSRAGLVEAVTASAELRMLGRLFRLLRDEREFADYSHEIVVDRSAALTMVEHARVAVATLDAGSYGDAAWQAFVALMLMEAKPRTYQLPAKVDNADQ